MADFCHDFDPGGLGCCRRPECPDPCIGDFQWALTDWAGLEPGYEVNLGICEGHGTAVVLVCEESGRLVFEHVPFTDMPVEEFPDKVVIRP